MTEQVFESYKTAIYNTFHDVVDITYPALRGSQNNLLFVKTAGGDFVAKFNTRDMVIKNHDVSSFARKNGILAPDISVRNYDDMWFECYPLVRGKTLFERIGDGMPTCAIKRAFDEMLVQFTYMDALPVKSIHSNKCINVRRMTYQHVKNANNVFLAHVLSTFVYCMNYGAARDSGLYHVDISPKNVVVDENGKLISLLDMDSMAICDCNYAFGALADKWASLGFNVNELYDKYEDMTCRKLNRGRINVMLNMLHLGKHIMFRTNKNRTK